ncbi:hypothetical protein [Anaeromyxobacter oryzae]|uniref:Lipoprotein n=1 Tax=Anaeromyxobacter oryzae TaxID=2918170 RepID=A0ABN6MNS7_9BACT|nr:hypothetical protein [Anaeromyxobacter oryzae]BDG02676.1 hypothetical protein AMOR_16720 [Anaeromyxobacter oryzae]
MKKTLFAALCAVATGCGGGSSFDPNSVKFSYSASSPVAAYSPESYAVAAGQTGLSDAQPLTQTTDPVEADARANSVVTLGDTMASECMDGTGTGMTTTLMAKAAQIASARKVVALGLNGAVPAAFDASCITVIPGKITYNHCSETSTVTSTDGTTETITASIDGSVTRTVAVGTASASWDISVRATMTTSDPMRIDVTNHYTGGLQLTATTLAGNSRSDVTLDASAQGMNVSAAYSTLADYDLDFATGPFCVTGGTLELRRVWSKRPTGATATDLPNQAVLFTWNGCGNVTAAWGTPQ